MLFNKNGFGNRVKIIAKTAADIDAGNDSESAPGNR
jgi:hypothetical protein